MSTDRSRRWVWGKISGHRGHFWVIKINYIMNDTGEGGGGMTDTKQLNG